MENDSTENHGIGIILSQCGSGNPSQQIAAIYALLERKTYTAVSVLVELLRSNDAIVRSTAADALGHLGIHEPEVAGQALMNLLGDPEDIVRSEVVDALGILRYTPAVTAIRSLLQTDPEPLVRASAAETLGDLGDTHALTELEMALHDTDENVRGYAAGAIGVLGTSLLLPKLQTYVREEESLRVKVELYGARYRLGASKDLDLILNLLGTADEPLATLILNLLTDIAQHKVPPTLTNDSSRICKALDECAQRIEILYPHVEQIKMLITNKKPDEYKKL